ncbi:MAG TPA: hypothetical protein VLZ54_02600, partial [Arenibacter sp.]|nr:hypothetical protein [Arenibacter sp.]
METDSYRIFSGIYFLRVPYAEMDSVGMVELEAKRKKEEDRKKNFASFKKRALTGIMEKLFFLEGSK